MIPKLQKRLRAVYSPQCRCDRSHLPPLTKEGVTSLHVEISHRPRLAERPAKDVKAMMVLMHAAATAAQIDDVMDRIKVHKMQAMRMPGDDHVAIGVASAIPP